MYAFNRDLGRLYPTLQVIDRVALKERRPSESEMRRVKQSDAAKVLLNAANKEVVVSAESNEGRAATKGNLRSQSMRRFIVGRSPAPRMLTAVERMMKQLQLPINHRKTRCLRCPQEPMDFLGCRIGRNYRFNGSSYIGTLPSKASVQNLCRKVSEQTSRKYGLMDSQETVKRLNWMLSGWSNYFYLGQVSPAYSAIDNHMTKRLRQSFCRMHQIKVRKYVRFSNKRLWNDHGLACLSRTTTNLPWAKA